jgi:hypothetical protein
MHRTAIWAGAPVRIGPHNVPVITDPAVAARDVPRATRSAVTHAREPGADAILKTLASAMKTLDEGTAALFTDLTELGLGDAPAAQTWRKLMTIDLSFFRSETSQRLRAEGRAEGRAEDVLLLLDRRGVEVPDDARERIAGCRETETLDRWFTRAITAESVGEVFGED